jgi:hypothetical protein
MLAREKRKKVHSNSPLHILDYPPAQNIHLPPQNIKHSLSQQTQLKSKFYRVDEVNKSYAVADPASSEALPEEGMGGRPRKNSVGSGAHSSSSDWGVAEFFGKLFGGNKNPNKTTLPPANATGSTTNATHAAPARRETES